MPEWFNDETPPKKPQDPATDPFAQSAQSSPAADISIMPVIETPGSLEPGNGFIEQSVEMTQGQPASHPHPGFTAMAAAPHAAQREATYDALDKASGFLGQVGAGVALKNPAVGGIIGAVSVGVGIGSQVGRVVGNGIDNVQDALDEMAGQEADAKMREQLRQREAQNHPAPGSDPKQPHRTQ